MEGSKAPPVENMIREVLPKNGLVYSEKGNLSEVLCKPKIMPIKSLTLEKMEQLEQAAQILEEEEAEEQGNFVALNR